MSQWERDEYPGSPGPGSLLLLLGVAVGAAAAFLLGTKQGQQVRDQVAGRAGDWKAQAADAIAQGREKLIHSVEEQAAPRDAGPVREKPL